MSTSKDALSRLKKHYNALKPTDAPAGLFELADPVVNVTLEACAYTISYQDQQIAELKVEIERLRQQVNYRGKE